MRWVVRIFYRALKHRCLSPVLVIIWFSHFICSINALPVVDTRLRKASQARGAQTNLRRHGGLVNTESSAVVLSFLELTVSDGLALTQLDYLKLTRELQNFLMCCFLEDGGVIDIYYHCVQSRFFLSAIIISSHAAGCGPVRLSL